MRFLFGEYALDSDRRELCRCGELVPIEPQVFDLLVHLIHNRDHVVSKDDLLAAVWHGRIVSESTLNNRINAARRAIGDSGDQQALVRTIARKGIRFVGDVVEHAKANTATPAAAAPTAGLNHEVHFCTASDGVRIAYALAGQGPPLLKTANWLNHLEYDWQSPIWSHLLHALAAEHRLIRYDARGTGLSDWDVPDMSFEASVLDLESVVEATGLQRFALLGISQGCRISVAYALRYPKRVTHLVLYGGAARGRRKRDSSKDIELSDAMIALMRHGWGQENPAFRQVFTTRFIPGGTAEQMQWFNDLQRITTSPENAARIRQTFDRMDITNLLAQVQTPTLVLHCRNDAAVPFEEGRRLAAGIPGARFVALEGSNHLILKGDPGLGRFLDEIKGFLKG